MKPIVEKLISSGLIDKHLVKLFETWGYLPEGASENVKKATKEAMISLAEEVAGLINEDEPIKETPYNLVSGTEVLVDFYKSYGSSVYASVLALNVPAIDNKHSLTFKMKDVTLSWFVPGYWVQYSGQIAAILSHTVLYNDDTPFAIEVHVARLTE